MTPPMFRAPDGCASGTRVVLGGAEGHHAADVRRLRPDEPITLTDGSGRVWHGTVADARRGSLDITVDEEVVTPPPQPRLTVVQALAKGGRDEDAVEAMTEVGVDEFVGWQAARSIAKWTDRTAARWESTAAAASRQARRAWWPAVSGPESREQIATRIAAADLALVLHETADHPLAGVDVPATGEVLVVVGPEGGITQEEVTAYVDAGAHAVRLGTTVLRSSTAGVVAASLILGRSRWA